MFCPPGNAGRLMRGKLRAVAVILAGATFAPANGLALAPRAFQDKKPVDVSALVHLANRRLDQFFARSGL